MDIRNSQLARTMEYPRFRGGSASVVLIDSGYLVTVELANALLRQGHRVHPIAPGDDFIRRLLHLLVEVRPDFLITVNHLGFDEEGKLTGLLTDLRLPFASWYVDSPAFIVTGKRNVSPFCTVFCWEKGWIPVMKEVGFEDPVFLPLATDPNIFRPHAVGATGWHADVSFVGNSMTGAVKKWEKKVLPEKTAALQEAVLRQKLDRTVSMATILRDMGEPDAASAELQAALVWETTRQYRLEVVRNLVSLQPVIYGDAGWKELLGEYPRLRPEVHYHNELPLVYGGTKVSINATSFQMNTAVNQRVFDCPACGGFVLSDRTADLEEFFSIGDEAVCYDSPEEAADLAAWYLAHDTERRRIAERGRSRVLADHTYDRRVATLIDTMKRRYS